MGKKKHLDDIERLFSKSPIVTMSSIARLLKSKKTTTQYAKQLVRNLLLQGKIKKIAKGCYSLHDDPTITVFCLKPAYLGLQDALSMHGLWEQETVPVILTTRKVRQGIRHVSGMNVLVRRIDRRYFFGFDYMIAGDFYAPVSDIEKTLIDIVYYHQHIDKEVLREFRKRMDQKKLKEYLQRYPKRFRERVVKLIG